MCKETDVSKATERLRNHVASYKSMSSHRDNCLDVCDEVDSLTAELNLCQTESEARRENAIQYRTVLDRLARLGNEPHYGNSDGNMIARAALEDTP